MPTTPHLAAALSLSAAVAAALAAQAPEPPVALQPQVSVVFRVQDLSRSVDFFGRTLGAEVAWRLDEAGFAELTTAVPGLRIGLARGARPATGSPAGADGASVVPTFAVASAADATARLQALGVDLLRPAQQLPGPDMPGPGRLVAFADPDGNEIQLVESPRQQEPDGADAAAAAFAKVAFLVGGWRDGAGGTTTEEVWTGPLGGAMYGTNRTLRGDRLAMFELLRITFTDGELCYEARPAGRAATVFRLTQAAPGRVTFGNPGHDFPKRIHYWREGDRLRAAIDDGTDGGKRMEFGWRRLAAR